MIKEYLILLNSSGVYSLMCSYFDSLCSCDNIEGDSKFQGEESNNVDEHISVIEMSVGV